MTNTTAVPDLPALIARDRVESIAASCMGTATHSLFMSMLDDFIKNNQATQPAPSGDAVEVLRSIADNLEGYAESYARMARQNKEDPRVHMTSVEVDIRQNMKGFVLDLLAATTSRAATVAKDTACKTCNGTGLVDDGEIDCYPNGEPYMNGPVKCVKDCPICTKPEASAANQQAGEFEPYAFLVTLHDGRVVGTYFDRDGAEYSAKSYGNASKIVPLYLAAPISEGTGKPTAADAGGLSAKASDDRYREGYSAGWNEGRAAERPWMQVKGKCLYVSRCDWIYPNATDDGAGARDEDRFNAIGRRDGDIVLSAPMIGSLDAQDLATMLAYRPTAVMAVAAPAACNGDAIVTDEFTETMINGIGSGEWRKGELTLDRVELAAVVKGVAHIAIDLAARAGTGSAGSDEPCAPAILEALSYHGRERDDLTLDDAVKAFRFGYKEVRQRDDRAMLAQIIHLLASAPEDTRVTKVEAAPGNAGEGVA